MTLNQFIYAIKEGLTERIGDDFVVDDRLIEFHIHLQRALWIRNELNRNRSTDPRLIQDLGCLELEDVDASTCCVPAGCVVKRVKKDLPAFIELYHSPLVTRVGPINKTNIAYPLRDLHFGKRSGHGRFNRNLTYSYLEGNKLYLVNNCDPHFVELEHINVQGVLENPTVAAEYTTCEGNPCYDVNSQYPLSSYMFVYFKDKIIQNLLNKSLAPEDKLNNADGEQGN